MCQQEIHHCYLSLPHSYSSTKSVRENERRVGSMLHSAAKEQKSIVTTSYYNGASHISHAMAENAFSKVHLGHGLVASIGAGEDVAVRSLIVSSGNDSDVHPRASKVPPNPPLSASRRSYGISVSVSRRSSFSCSSRRSRTSLARMLRAATLALLSVNSWPW